MSRFEIPAVIIKKIIWSYDKMLEAGEFMSASIVSKTIVVLPLIFFFGEAQAQDLVGAARDSMGVASPRTESASPAAGSNTSPAVAVNTDAAVAAFDSLKCLKLEAGKGLDNEWPKAADEFNSEAKKCSSSFPSAFQEAIKKYSASRQACIDRNQLAGRNCLEKCSQHIQEMVSGAQVLLTGMSQFSIVESCSKMGQAMKLAQMGMSAFTLACGAQKALCENSCGTAIEALETAKKILNQPIMPDPDKVGCETALVGKQSKLITLGENELAPETKVSMAGKKIECTGYAANLAAAGLGILSAIKQGRQANACENATNGSQVAAADPCTVPATKDSPKCICKANPRSPGCELATNLSSDGSGGFGQTGGGQPAAGIIPGGGAGLGTNSGISDFKAGADGAKGAAPPIGGGGGSAGLGGGNSGSNDGRGAADAITKMNTGIYGGEGGGGGGGYGGRGGGGQKTAAYNPELAQKISAEREIASLRNQVSSQGGKSNWEKVKDRYTQEKTNLLGR